MALRLDRIQRDHRTGEINFRDQIDQTGQKGLIDAFEIRQTTKIRKASLER